MYYVCFYLRVNKDEYISQCETEVHSSNIIYYIIIISEIYSAPITKRT